MNATREFPHNLFWNRAQLSTHTPPLLHIITPPPQILLPLTHELSTRSGQIVIGPSGRKQPVCPMRETRSGRSTGRMWVSSTDAHICVQLASSAERPSELYNHPHPLRVYWQIRVTNRLPKHLIENNITRENNTSNTGELVAELIHSDTLITEKRPLIKLLEFLFAKLI